MNKKSSHLRQCHKIEKSPPSSTKAKSLSIPTKRKSQSLKSRRKSQ